MKRLNQNKNRMKKKEKRKKRRKEERKRRQLKMKVTVLREMSLKKIEVDLTRLILDLIFITMKVGCLSDGFK